jgi:hypothetical protein
MLREATASAGTYLATAGSAIASREGSTGSGVQGRRAARIERSKARWQRWGAWTALAALTAIGTAVRVRGLTSFGLWRDDAWAVMSIRVGFGTAWHMWSTAPGFGLFERTFILIGPRDTWWAQLPELAAGVAAIPAMYALCRYMRMGRLISLLAVFVVCISPVTSIYSTRVKEYAVDFLLTVLLLAAAEAVRRNPELRQLSVLAVSSFAAFFISASEVTVIIAAWLALGLTGLARREVLPRILVFGVATAAACGVVLLLFFRHIPSVLANSFGSYYIEHSSVRVLGLSTYDTLWNVVSEMFGLSGQSVGIHVLLTLGLVGLAILGAVRNPPMRCAAFTLLIALVFCAARIAPIGLGRLEMYLYPAILLLWAAGLARLAGAVAGALRTGHRRTALVVVLAALAAVGIPLTVYRIATAPQYPGTDAQSLASYIEHHEQPGDHVFVSELMRYSWALYETQPRIAFGPYWSPGWTVVSTDPHTFIVPSEYFEGKSRPATWAEQMSKYKRLWFVWTSPLNLTPSYAALIKDGWHPTLVVGAPGCALYLMERSTGN